LPNFFGRNDRSVSFQADFAKQLKYDRIVGFERFVVWAVYAHSVEVGKKQGKGCTECEFFNWIFE
jgi:hypothetical protein